MAFDDPFVAVFAYGLGVNAACFLAFAWDKHCARNQMWRVSEQTLLLLAAAGGTPGAFAGRWALRHKTTKQPFVTYLRAIAAIQVILLAILSFPQGRSALWSLVQRVLG
jgi:uncharacterized membrane protein YsdA (DUF1294 family)